MKSPCEGCAYTEGAAANKEPDNFIKAQLCVHSGIPFYCHHDAFGAELAIKDIPVTDLRQAVQDGRVTICQGWRREVGRLAHRGHFLEDRSLLRTIGEIGLISLSDFCTLLAGEEKQRAARMLGDAMRWLWRKAGRKLKGDVK